MKAIPPQGCGGCGFCYVAVDKKDCFGVVIYHNRLWICQMEKFVRQKNRRDEEK
jgi:hypothetical protein